MNNSLILYFNNYDVQVFAVSVAFNRFLWGFTAILGKLITVDALELVFFRMLFAALFLYLFIRIVKKQSMKVSVNYSGS